MSSLTTLFLTGTVLFTRLAGSALNLCLVLVITQSFNLDDTALFFLFLTLMQALAILGRLGMDVVALREVSTAAPDSTGAITGFATTLSLGFCLLFFLLAIPAAPLYQHLLPGLDRDPMFLYLLALVVSAVSQFTILGEILKARKKLFFSQILQMVLFPALAIPMVVFWGADIKAVFFLLAAASFLTAGLSHLYFLHAGFLTYSFTALKAYVHLGKSGLPVMLGTFLNFGVMSLATIFLNYYGSSLDMSFYGVCVRLALILGFIMVAVNSIFSPRFAKAHAAQQWGKLQKLLLYSSMTALAFGFLPTLILLLFNDAVLSLFGQQYAQAGLGLTILLGGQLINIATGGVGVLLIMIKKESVFRNIMFVIFIAAILAYPPVITRHGWIGACWVTSLLWAGQNLVTCFMSYRFIQRNKALAP